jgi:DNA integrity scanning protein DisA with diadenylate cyclase activity
MKTKEEYSEEEIKKILQKVKPEKNIDTELRFQRLENELKVAFLAVSRLKSEIDKMQSAPDEDYSDPKMQLEELKKVPKKKAALLIREYISKNPGCKTSDIIFSLRLHPDIVLPILRKLREEGALRSEKIGC